MAEPLQKQREALINCIKESDKKERQRIQRLSQTKNKHEHSQLYERFLRDRQLEQEKIECLMNDYKTLEERVKKKEDLSKFFAQRTRQKLKQSSAESPFGENQQLPNRFEGLEDHIDIIFFENVVNKFDRYDKKFQAKLNYKPYDPVHEERKLKLLTEKRDLLNRLITIQKAAEYGTNSNGSNNSTTNNNTQYYHQNNHQRRSSDTRSVTTASSSTSSRLSYATFATNANNISSARMNSSNGNGRPPAVPRLKL